MSGFWTQVLIVLHVIVALGIIGLVLLQHGKGADMGSGFGGGASSSLFGATGSANFLSRTTAVLAAVFFATSLGLAYLATNHRGEGGAGVMDAVKDQPAAPGAPRGAGRSRQAARAKPARPGEALSLRMRLRSVRGRAHEVRCALLPDRDPVHPVRPRDRIPVSLGGGAQGDRARRLCRDDGIS